MAGVSPYPIMYASVTVAAPAPAPVPATQIPNNPAGVPLAGYAVLPYANARVVTVINTGANPLLFGTWNAPDQTWWPTLWGGAGPNVIPTEGYNCTRIPVGASLTIDIGSFQERGNMGFGSMNAFNTAAPTLPGTDQFPITVIWFSAIGGAGSGTVTYINKLGLF